MPSVAEQQRLGYVLVVDPATAVVPPSVPIWQGDLFQRPAVGTAFDIHIDEEGRLAATLEFDDAYADQVVTGLNWALGINGPALWGMSIFPLDPGGTPDA